jgi:ADP-heptose:LPS heptosyltransferase
LLDRERNVHGNHKESQLVLEKQVEIAGLVVHDSFTLGDLVYLGAMLAALREQVPTLPISVVVGAIGKNFPFFESIGVSRVQLAVPWDDRRWYKRPLHTLKGLPHAALGIRSLAKDSLLADARGDVRQLVVATLAGRRTLTSLSFTSWPRLWGRAPTHIFLERRNWLWKLQDELGLPRTDPKWPWIKVPPAPPKESTEPPTILLSYGGGGELKKWDPEKWLRLASILRAQGFHCVFIHEPGRKPSVLDTEDEWSGNIEQLASLLASADLVVAIDSFVGHVAAAVGAPTLTIFGPQLPELWTPWGPHARYVIAEPFSCRPCTQKRCVRPGASCMDLLDVRVVADAVESFFATPAAIT